MKKIFAFFLIPLVILSSGCTIPGTDFEIPFLPNIFPGMQVNEQRHDVIVIESLQAVPSSNTRSGQSTRLRAVVRNLQQPEYDPVEDVVIGLYNDCGIFEVTGEFCSGTDKPEYKQETGMVQCSISKFHPQSTAIVEWKLEAKDVNVETSCKVGVLAKYDYETYSTGSVTFVNKAELERLISEGKSYSETGIATIGEGPLKPYIEILNQPIVVDDSAKGIMSFWLENKGNGIVQIGDSGKDNGNVVFSCDSRDRNQICLNVESIREGQKELVLSKTGPQVTLEECIREHLRNNNAYFTNFLGKATPKYSCEITLEDPSRVKQEKTYQITADVHYGYKFNKEIMLTVKPEISL